MSLESRPLAVLYLPPPIYSFSTDTIERVAKAVDMSILPRASIESEYRKRSSRSQPYKAHFLSFDENIAFWLILGMKLKTLKKNLKNLMKQTGKPNYYTHDYIENRYLNLSKRRQYGCILVILFIMKFENTWYPTTIFFEKKEVKPYIIFMLYLLSWNAICNLHRKPKINQYLSI